MTPGPPADGGGDSGLEHRVELGGYPAGAGDVLAVAITGRATGAAIEAFRAAIEAALAGGRPFAVLFDRRPLTAPTPDGSEALERWGSELTPRLEGACTAWADVYDERRAASLLRAAGAAEHGAHLPYPHRIFADPDAARAWLRSRLAPVPVPTEEATR